MKVAVRYYSKSGNTKKLADAIAEALKTVLTGRCRSWQRKRAFISRKRSSIVKALLKPCTGGSRMNRI